MLPCLWQGCRAASKTHASLYAHICVAHAQLVVQNCSHEHNLVCKWHDCGAKIVSTGRADGPAPFCVAELHFLGHAGFHPLVCCSSACPTPFRCSDALHDRRVIVPSNAKFFPSAMLEHGLTPDTNRAPRKRAHVALEPRADSRRRGTQLLPSPLQPQSPTGHGPPKKPRIHETDHGALDAIAVHGLSPGRRTGQVAQDAPGATDEIEDEYEDEYDPELFEDSPVARPRDECRSVQLVATEEGHAEYRPLRTDIPRPHTELPGITNEDEEDWSFMWESDTLRTRSMPASQVVALHESKDRRTIEPFTSKRLH